MTKWGLVIDISKCNACYCCLTACKDEYWNNDILPILPRNPGMGSCG
jgi:Fe-S-cluster-containing dehydrogenase component